MGRKKRLNQRAPIASNKLKTAMVKKKRQPDANDDNSSTDGADENSQSPALSACTCQHINKSVDVNKLRKLLKANGLALDCLHCMRGENATSAAAAGDDNESTSGETNPNFQYDNTLWLCLKCGTQLCGRARNQHALNHYKTPHSDCHALTMNTRSYEIWCYECDNEVRANSRKKLVECVEIVKKIAEKSWTGTGNTLFNVDGKVVASWEAMCPPLATTQDDNSIKNRIIELPSPPPIPGMAKRITEPTESLTLLSTMNSGINTILQHSKMNNVLPMESLPRVRGLTNLGNTCFFNAVMQCLAQTPYLLEVLKESSEPGEEFILPGGTFKFKNDENVELPMIKGTLSSWGGLTAALAHALEELQSGGGVFTPSRLFDKLCTKCPQFRGGDQHDSHELLRHLLESVRSEDLKRYQRVILQNLGYKDQDNVSEELRQKCKIYGNQAADRILRPEQVFRGFLVSTLTCQECFNVSSRHENFLDVSLPVSVEKPQPPIRRKSSPENEPVTSFYLNPSPKLTSPTAPTGPLTKKERRAMRSGKHQHNKVQKYMLEDIISRSDQADSNAERDGNDDENGSSFSASEESDADVEDNLIDDNEKHKSSISAPATVTFADPNGNNQQQLSPINLEKRDDSPENMDKDSLDEDENDSGIATSPANVGNNFLPTSETNCMAPGGNSESVDNTAQPTAMNSSVLALGLSEKGANLVRQLSLVDRQTESKLLQNGARSCDAKRGDELAGVIGELQLNERKAARMQAKRVRTQSHSDWSTTMAPRYQCEDGECSVQSCLNNFTAVELMTGNNKVGCENCTKTLNGDDPKAKTVNTNATKQFLISSPPAVLILHLKRFQLGPRCMFRKLTRSVTFPMILDIAPFCGSKVKNLPNIDRKQKKLLYALYGVVEHAGNMYGGHYTAFVKVRPKLKSDDKRWKFIPQGSKAELDQDDEQRKKLEELLAKEKAREMRLKAADDSDDFSSSGSSTSSSSSDQEETPRADEELGAVGGVGDENLNNVQVPRGTWYYVSDSHVKEVGEEAVLQSQAYLLFYERIY